MQQSGKMEKKMSKPEVLQSTSISTEVAFKLDKEDISDMVIEERCEILEEHLSALQKQRKQVKKEHDALLKKHDDALVKLVKKELASKVKVLEKFSKLTAEYETGGNINIVDPEYVEQVKYVKNNGAGRRRYEKSILLGELAGISNTVDVEIRPKNLDNRAYIYLSVAEINEELFLWKENRTFNKEELLGMKSVQDVIAVNKQLVELDRQILPIESELSNVETSSRRAKAKIVRQLLNNTDEGKRILGKVPTLNSTLSLPSKK